VGCAPKKNTETINATNQPAAPALPPPHWKPIIKIKTAAMGEKASSHFKMNAISMDSPVYWQNQYDGTL
jgi:hypothetical protein